MENSLEQFSLLVNIALPVFVLVVAYLIGSWFERRHFQDIQRREADAHGFPVVSFDRMPDEWRAQSGAMISGNVVVSLDYFKRVIAGLRSLVGGRIKSLEPLLERARREAVLRMIEEARSQGYNGIFNVRLETSRLASARGDGKGTAGIEMLAYGTAVKFTPGPTNSR